MLVSLDITTPALILLKYSIAHSREKVKNLAVKLTFGFIFAKDGFEFRYTLVYILICVYMCLISHGV